MTVSERMKLFLKTIPNSKGKMGMSEGEYELKAKLSKGAISGWGDGLTTKTLQKITAASPELNTIWLLHGQGAMKINPENEVHEDQEPYELALSKLVKLLKEANDRLRVEQENLKREQENAKAVYNGQQQTIQSLIEIIRPPGTIKIAKNV